MQLDREDMIFERDNIQEQYASLNVLDATDSITLRGQDLDEIDRVLTEKRAEAEWEVMMVAQWSTDADNMENSEEMREEAKAERDNAQMRLDELNVLITNMDARRVEVNAGLTED
jgi:hypothetical protein